MNKSILITENKIIKEDAIEQVSSSLSFERGLSFIGDILKGVINITESTINDIAAGIKLLGVAVTFPNEFENALRKGQEKRSELNRDWLSLKSNLGIDKPIDDFLNIAVPGLAIANKYLDKKMTRSYFKNDSFLKTLISPAKSLLDINKLLLSDIFDKGLDDASSKLKKTSSEYQKYYKWMESLNDEDLNKVNKWTYENQDDFKTLVEMINKGRSRDVINFFKKEVLIENKSFLIKNKMLIVEQEEQIPENFHETRIKEEFIKRLMSIELGSLIDEEKEYSENMETLLKEYQKIIGENEEEVAEILEKETETN